MIITKDLRLIFKNEIGKEIELSFFSPYYVLQNVEEELQNTITTVKQNLIHGSKYLSNTLDERYITISGFILLRDGNEELLSNLRRTFNPTTKGTLIAENSKVKKKVEVYVENLVDLTKETGILNFTINLVAHTPFWEDESKSEYFALLQPSLKFPLVIPKNQGIQFGVRRSILETVVENVGDVESGFRVRFVARSGTVTNPQIYGITNKKTIKINYEMGKGDIIEVINYPELKKVTLNGTVNAFKYLDIESDFFNLDIGYNKMGYRADVNTINLDVILMYAPRYLGVE